MKYLDTEIVDGSCTDQFLCLVFLMADAMCCHVALKVKSFFKDMFRLELSFFYCLLNEHSTNVLILRICSVFTKRECTCRVF